MKTPSTTTAEIQKLQRTIVNGLEDVKAQHIMVFNTTDLSPLFERVVVASGTSNRQTKALAASVRDAVRQAGFAKPRVEGEENGEWIIVDCGSAVVHIMQPAIRQYYQLEEIWGDKPVRLRAAAKSTNQTGAGGASKSGGKTSAKTTKEMAVKTPAKSPTKPTAKTSTKNSPTKPVAKRASVKRPATKPPATKTPAAKKAAIRTPRRVA